MRVVFFGTADFAVPILRAAAPHVVLVVTQPDRPASRGLKLQASPVKFAALELGLPVETPEKSRAPEFVDRLRECNADLHLVAAYGQILSRKVLESARHGGINLHGSLLPKYRGAAPIQRGLLQGDTLTGVTLMQMDIGMDTGDMIERRTLSIGPDETYGELQVRLADLAAEMTRDWLPRLALGNYPREPQDPEQATYAPKIEKAEAELHWDESAAQAYNRYRAFTPNPGAFLRTSFGILKLTRVARSSESGPPGTLVAPGIVAFAEGALEIIEAQPEGKKRMSGRDVMNGWRLKVGDPLAPETKL